VDSLRNFVTVLERIPSHIKKEVEQVIEAVHLKEGEDIPYLVSHKVYITSV
jgi:hypothetical protein